MSKSTKKKTREEFIELSRIKHNDRYNYSKVDYINSQVKVAIVCVTHDEFYQTPASHLFYGHGCPKCRKNSLKTTETFITESNLVHNNLYNYSKVNYTGAEVKVEIICNMHGSFWQTPSSHRCGKGCPKCKYGKLEKEWLDYNKVPDIHGITRQVRININQKLYILDGFDPATNMVYEFNGDRHHGNPLIYNPNDINPICKLTYGELYEKTLLKRKNILAAGYNLTEVWQSDWKILKTALSVINK